MPGSIIHVGSSVHVNNSFLPVPPLNQLQVSSIPEVNKSPTTLSVNLDQVTEKVVAFWVHGLNLSISNLQLLLSNQLLLKIMILP